MRRMRKSTKTTLRVRPSGGGGEGPGERGSRCVGRGRTGEVRGDGTRRDRGTGTDGMVAELEGEGLEREQRRGGRGEGAEEGGGKTS